MKKGKVFKMAYSKETRRHALELCQKGMSNEQVGEQLDISRHTIAAWKKLLFTTGSLEMKKVERKAYKYTPSVLREYLDRMKF